MTTQPELFSPWASTSTKQAELFEPPTSDRACPHCGRGLVETPEGFSTCPLGHMKLIDTRPIGNEHLLRDRWREEKIQGMGSLYEALGLLPASDAADIVLIRSHVAYWTGHAAAERCTINRSRGHSFRVTGARADLDRVVHVVDHYDHREGVIGWK